MKTTYTIVFPNITLVFSLTEKVEVVVPYYHVET